MTEPCPRTMDQLLERHGAARLPVQYIPAVFEHLLDCDDCNERFEAELNFERELRQAITHNVAEPRAEKRNWLSIVPVPAPALGVLAVFAVAILFVPGGQRNSGPLQVLDLGALRGDRNATLRSGDPLELRLATVGLDPARAVRVQIADDSGREVWQGTAQLSGYKWEVKPETSLRPARYWVRVLDPERPDLHVREYAFEVR